MSTILNWWPKRFLINPVKPLLFVILAIALIIPFGCAADADNQVITSDESRMQIVDADGNIITIDKNTRTITTLELAHHKIHIGKSFTVIDVVDLANGAVRDIQITTPDTPVVPHFIFVFQTESETEWMLFEDVTINVPGAVSLMINANRNSTNLATLLVATIDNANVGNANADTAVAGAVEIYHGIAGAGKDAGADRRTDELLLKRNEDYTLRFVANAAGYVSYHLDWYEHTALR